MKVVWLERAILDLHHVREFLRLDNPAIAEKVGNRIESAIVQLARFPEMGRVGRRPWTRELIISDLPYRIIYRVCDEAVQILRVYHFKRKWPHSS